MTRSADYRHIRSQTTMSFLTGTQPIVIAANITIILLACLTSTVESDCGGELTDSYGVVVSPGYPQAYPTDTTCQWHIAPNATELNGTETGMVLYFRTFQTQDVSEDDVEALLVFMSDPNNGNSTVAVRSYRGKLTPGTSLPITSSNQVWLRFRSSITQTSSDRLGFRIIYIANGADVQCDADPLENGGIKNDNGSFSLFTQVEFQCDRGFRIDGVNTGTCTLDGDGAETISPQWTHVPRCVSTCRMPPSITNGTHSSSDPTHSVNSTVSYSCDEPYLLTRSPTITCSLNSKGIPAWNSAAPSCSIPNCAPNSPIQITGSGALVNPSFPQRFVASGKSCRWQIRVEADKVINFNVSYFDVPAPAQLTITDGTTKYLFHVLHGGQAPSLRSVNSTSASVEVVYNGPPSVNSSDHRGFYISFRAVEPTSVPVVPTRTTPRFSTITAIVTFSSQSGQSSTEGVPQPESDDGGSSAGKIAAGVTVPIILLLIIAGVVYWCYRKKYPVRMIMGRDFGKFSNPEYRPSRKATTLVREDAEEFFQQTQPTGRVSLIFGSSDEESRVEFVNNAFQYDSQDADEEEVERRFRERKAYLFKKDDEEEEGVKEQGDKDTNAVDGKRPGKKDRPKQNGKLNRDQGHDNPAYTDDSDADGTEASSGRKEAGNHKSDSDSTASDLSSSSDKDDVSTASIAGSVNIQANPSVSSSVNSTNPQDSEKEYNSNMTVQEYMRAIEKGEREADEEKTAENPENGQEKVEESPQQSNQQNAISGHQLEQGMTVKQFLLMCKEKRSLSDVNRSRAESLNAFDRKKSARRRAQSAEDIWAMAAESCPNFDAPTEKLSLEEDQEVPSATPTETALQKEAEEPDETQDNPINLFSKENESDSSLSHYSVNDDESDSSLDVEPVANGTLAESHDSVDSFAQPDNLPVFASAASSVQVTEEAPDGDSATPAVRITSDTDKLSGTDESTDEDSSTEAREQSEDKDTVGDNADHYSASNSVQVRDFHNVPENASAQEHADDFPSEPLGQFSGDGQSAAPDAEMDVPGNDDDGVSSGSFVILPSNGASDSQAKEDDSDNISMNTQTSISIDNDSAGEEYQDRSSPENSQKFPEETERDSQDHLDKFKASDQGPSNGSSKRAITVQGLPTLTYSDVSSGSASSSSSDESDGEFVESGREFQPRSLQLGLEPSANAADVRPEEEHAETQPLGLSFTSEPADTQFFHTQEPGALQFVNTAAGEPAAGAVQLTSSPPPQPTRLRGLAALRSHPNARSNTSDSDSDMELTAEDIEAALQEGSDVSSDEEVGQQPRQINPVQNTLRVEPAEVLVFNDDDNEDIDV